MSIMSPERLLFHFNASLGRANSWVQNVKKEYYRDLVKERTAKTVLKYFTVLLGLKLAYPFRASYECMVEVKKIPIDGKVQLGAHSFGAGLAGILGIAFLPIYLIVVTYDTIMTVKNAKIEANQLT